MAAPLEMGGVDETLACALSPNPLSFPVRTLLISTSIYQCEESHITYQMDVHSPHAKKGNDRFIVQIRTQRILNICVNNICN